MFSLQHDLHPETVNFALHTIPQALSEGKLKMTSIIDCQHKPLSDAYVETASANANRTQTGTAQSGVALSYLALPLWASLFMSGVVALVAANL